MVPRQQVHWKLPPLASTRIHCARVSAAMQNNAGVFEKMILAAYVGLLSYYVGHPAVVSAW